MIMHFTEKSCTILTQPSIIFMTPINSLAFVEAFRKVFEHIGKKAWKLKLFTVHFPSLLTVTLDFRVLTKKHFVKYTS